MGYIALISFALLGLSQALPAACPAPKPKPVFTSYTALGDSYAAGLGSVERLEICTSGQSPASTSCTSDDCDKDIGAYGYQFAQKHGILAADGFQFLACSGANSTAVATTQVASPDFGDPDLVTVQAGGDDNHAFSSIIAACVFFVDDASCRAAVAAASADLPAIIRSVDATLAAVNARVSATATKALVGYLQFFSHDYDGNCTVVNNPIPADLQQEVNDLVVRANALLEQAAADRGSRFVSADERYEGHRWCDPEPWWILSTVFKNGTDTGGQEYNEIVLGHPTADGQNAYLSELEAVLGY